MATGGKGGAGHVPVADVAGRKHHALAVGVGGFDVLPTVDADGAVELLQVQMRHADEIDHVPAVVDECPIRETPRLPGVGVRPEDLPHVVGGPTQVAAGKDGQHQRRETRHETVGQLTGTKRMRKVPMM